MRIRHFLLFLLFSLSNPLLAQTHYCQTTFKYISAGDKMETVQQNCGAPSNTSTRRETKKETIKVTQWLYNVSFARHFSRGPTAMIISIKEGKVIGLRVGTDEVISTNVCNQSVAIKVGDLADTVTQVCGVDRVETEGEFEAETGEQEVTIWTYEYGEHQPIVTLRFEDGILKAITKGFSR